jgi:alkaline phosphatase D
LKPSSGPGYTGDYFDAFGNRMSVLAVANPAQYPGPGLEGLRLRATGYTVLSCDRRTRETTIAQWPRWVDPSAPGAKPYAGWPITMQQMDNGLWGASWELPLLEIREVSEPVIQVRSQQDDTILYTLRLTESSVHLPVRNSGQYTVVAFDPDGSFRREWRDLQARPKHALS